MTTNVLHQLHRSLELLFRPHNSPRRRGEDLGLNGPLTPCADLQNPYNTAYLSKPLENTRLQNLEVPYIAMECQVCVFRSPARFMFDVVKLVNQTHQFGPDLHLSNGYGSSRIRDWDSLGF